MLGRNSYSPGEFDAAAKAIAEALDAGEGPIYFNNLVLALDRRFVHRVRAVAGKTTNPLNELELIAESLMSSGGVFTTNTVIKWTPEQSVLGLRPGDTIALTRDDFERLSTAVLGQLSEFVG